MALTGPVKSKHFFREKNFGGTPALLPAYNLFFENVEEGIILEDDCLPDPSFSVREELLENTRKRANHDDFR